MSIGLEMTVVQSPTCLAADVNDEVVLMSVERGAYFALDVVAADIWRRITEPCKVAELCRALVVDYDATLDVIEVDVLGLLGQLTESGIVEIRA